MKVLQWGLVLLFTLALLATVVTHLAVYQQMDFFQKWFVYLLIADGVLVLLLFLAVGGLVVRQLRSWQRGERGARLSLRLTFLFWGMSLLPALLLYSVSVSAVFRGIESWFDIPLGDSFERGIAFGQSVIGGEFQRLEYAARGIAGSAPAQSGQLASNIAAARRQYQLDGIALYDPQGVQLTVAGEAGGRTLEAALMRRITEEGLHLNLKGSGTARAVEIAVPLRQPRGVGALWVVRALPAEIAGGLAEIERGRQEYEKLQILRSGLRWSFILTMSLSLALILFALGWISLRLGRGMTRPLVQLSAAAEAVGGGDFDRRLRESHPLEEVSHLNRSFNVMAGRLKQSQQQIAERQAALTRANAYMENLLSSLTTGVLTFSVAGDLSHYNAAAVRFCQVELEHWVGRAFLPESHLTAELAEAADALHKSKSDEWVERRVVLPDGEVLLLRASSLPHAAGGGMLMMIDDISRPLRAEREATWEEASRRFVHEIKNPLTPIQLAAERLRAKLAGRLDEEDDAMLNRLVEMIVRQVEAMRKMVDSFRLYADKRSSAPLEELQLNDLLRQVLFFYEDRQVALPRTLQEDLPPVSANAVTLRQLLHNLLGNAMEALEGRTDGEIRLSTAAVDEWVELTIADNGGGVPPELFKKMCEPYVTNKPGGSGLGLAMVRKTVDEHAGSMEMENGSRGLCVRVRLPRHRAAKD